MKFPWKQWGGVWRDWKGRNTPGIPSEEGSVQMHREGQQGLLVHSSILLCSPTGAKRNVPLELLVSGALSAVTATTEVSVRRPQAPVSVSLATRALAARSGYALRACMVQAAPCPVPVTLRTLSGMICGQVSLGQGLDGPQDGERLPGLWPHLQSGQSASWSQDRP